MDIKNRFNAHWLAGVVIAASLGTGIVTGAAMASADTGTATNTDITVAPATDSQNGGVATLTIDPRILIDPVPKVRTSIQFHEEVGVPKTPKPTTQPTQPK